MKVSSLIKKLLPYADKDLIFSTTFESIKRLPGPISIEDEDYITESGIYVLSDRIEIYLEAVYDD